MCTRGPGAFLCAPCSSPPISHFSPLRPPWRLHPSSYFQERRRKATEVHPHGMLGAATAQRAFVHPPAPTPTPKLSSQNMRTCSETIHYGLSFSCYFLFNLADLILELSSKTTRPKEKKKHVSSHEALGKSQESAALHDARGRWYGQSAEQGTSALRMYSTRTRPS